MLDILCHLLATVLKVKNRMVVWVQKGCERINQVLLPRDWVAACVVAVAANHLSPDSTIPRTLAPEKAKNPQFQVWFLLTVYRFTPL